MNILYVTTFFDNLGSSAAVRNYALVNGFIQNGHSVDVLTVKHPEIKVSKLFSSCSCRKIFRTKLGTSDFVVKTAKQQALINNSILKGLKKIVRNLLFFPDIYCNWHKLISIEQYTNYVLLISSSDSKSSHFTAKRIKQYNPQLRWIQIWGDPWSIDSTLDIISKIRAERKEKQLLRCADKIIYISELTYHAINNKYPNLSDKINYVPRSYCYEVRRAVRNEDKKVFDIVYPGGLNGERSCINFLNAIDTFNRTNDIKFEVHFYGTYLNNIVHELNHYDFVIIHPIVDFEKMIEIFRDTDALLFISNRAESTQIPGKLFDYMGTELPIVCILSDGNDRVKNFLSHFNKCLFFQDNFSEIAHQIITGKYEIERQFASSVIADEILK